MPLDRVLVETPRVEKIEKQDRASAVEALHAEQVLIGADGRLACRHEPPVRRSPASEDLERDLLLRHQLAAAPEPGRAQRDRLRLRGEPGRAAPDRRADVDGRRRSQVAAEPVRHRGVGIGGQNIAGHRAGQVRSREPGVQRQVHRRSGGAPRLEDVQTGALLGDVRDRDLGLP